MNEEFFLDEDEDFFRECEENNVPYIPVFDLRAPRVKKNPGQMFCCDFSSQWEVEPDEPCPGCGAS